MNWTIIAELIRREAAYWMALTVCPTREHWEQTYRFFYQRGDQVNYALPFIIDFERELTR